MCAAVFPVTQSAADDKYMGPATCASSNCHGSASPKAGTNVLQNEYATWYKNEAHSQAWKTLTTKESKIIGGHLGIKNPESAKLCLDCHATNVDRSRQGEKFKINEGVTCESCHGPAERWIKPHTARESTHSQNVSLGMIDLVSLSERSRICMDCHYGNDNQNVNHRLIGAGHPRLTFELDTYSVLQPNHWEVDADYVKRKSAYSSARAWLVGQALRSIETVEQMRSDKRSKFGVLPELTQFYCYNCHHSLTEDQWKVRSYDGKPGELHLNLSSLYMLQAGLKAVDAAAAGELAGKVAKLDSAYRDGTAGPLLNEIRTLLSDRIRPTVDRASFSDGVIQQMMKDVIAFAVSEPFHPYEVAEQCAMAMSALSATIDPGGKRYKAGIDGIYEALKKEEAFDPSAFKKAADKLSGK